MSWVYCAESYTETEKALLKQKKTKPKQYKYYFSWENQFFSNKVRHRKVVICYRFFNIRIFNSEPQVHSDFSTTLRRRKFSTCVKKGKYSEVYVSFPGSAKLLCTDNVGERVNTSCQRCFRALNPNLKKSLLQIYHLYILIYIYGIAQSLQL